MSGEKEAKRKEVAELLSKQSGGGNEKVEAESSKLGGMLEEFDKSLENEKTKLGRLKADLCSGRRAELDRTSKSLFSELERKREGVRTELDKLHEVLGRYEDRVRDKDEAERQLQSLEEIKVMLDDKLRNNLMKRVQKLKVRKNSNLIKLSAEAEELEEDVKRSEEETMVFEKEYTIFLGMMKKLSG